jgi:hypothetical protein
VSEFELADDFLPVYDVSDAVAVVVDANPERTWDALMAADLIRGGSTPPTGRRLGRVARPTRGRVPRAPR